MKRQLFLILVLISFQASYAQWEKTGWKSDFIIDNVNAVDSIIVIQIYLDSIQLRISKDYGKTWKDISKGLPKDIYFPIIAVKGTHIFALGHRLWVSHDLGETWSPKLISYSSLYKIRIAIFNDTLVAFNGEHLFFSINNGDTWSSREYDNENLSKICDMTSIEGDLLVLTQDSLYRSSDIGVTWKAFDIPNTFGDIPRISCSVNNILIGTYTRMSYGGTNYLYYSKDGGVTWNKVSDNIIKNAFDYQFLVIDEKFIVVKNDGIFLSTDYGDSWVNIRDKLPDKLTRADLELYVFNNKIYIKTKFELYTTDFNFENWETIIEGENYGPILSLKAIGEKLYVGSSYGNYSATYPDGLFYSTDHGDTWHGSGLIGEDVNSIFKIGDTLLVGLKYGIAFSTDEGATWEKRKYDFEERLDIISTTREIVVVKNRIFLRMDRLFYYTDDFGITWNKHVNGAFEAKEINLIDVNRDRLFVVTEHSVLYSADGGDTWLDITSNLPEDPLYVTAILADGDEVYLSTIAALYFTSDLGKSWAEIKTGFNFSVAEAPTAFCKIKDLLFASIIGKGVYYSKDKGDNWIRMKGIGEWDFNSGTFAVTNGYVYFCTTMDVTLQDCNIVYRAKISDFLSTPDAAQEPRRIKIVPNPASDFVSFKRFIPGEKIEIYSQWGLKVLEVIPSENKIDVSRLPAGVYFLKIGGEVGIFIKNH